MSAARVFPWHETIWARLQQQRQGGRLPHALLITGSTGLGKLQLAERLAGQLLCQTPTEAGACGECPACLLVAAGSHPDLRHITRVEDSRQIRIDSVRALTEFIAMKSQYGGYRVALVYPADAMNANAANSLLKTLEEPPAGAMLILVSDRPSGIPATVRSRCQQAALPMPARSEAEAWLREQSPDSAERAITLLPMTGGAPLQALAYVEQDVDQRLAALSDMLDELASGRAGLGQATDGWKKDELPLLLELLPYLVQQVVRRSTGLAVEGIAPSCGDGLDRRALHEYLAYLYNCRSLIDRPINAELAIEDLFIRWQRVSRRAA